jgi:uncharacterized protein (TIGR02646 family)
MIEFTRRIPEPPELTAFCAANPMAGPDDFNSLAFQSSKRAVKNALNADQHGLCAYCESSLQSNSGQIDHVKPKGGPNAHPHLTFRYDNYVHSCCHQPKHCGQRKGDRILYVEPGPTGCNDKFTLSTTGVIDARTDLSRNERHMIRATRDQLGLNCPSLRSERERWVQASLSVLVTPDADFNAFIANIPFRFILRRLVT